MANVYDRGRRRGMAVFEDNFFDMAPGQSRTIRVINPAGARELRISAAGEKPITVKLSK